MPIHEALGSGSSSLGSCTKSLAWPLIGRTLFLAIKHLDTIDALSQDHSIKSNTPAPEICGLLATTSPFFCILSCQGGVGILQTPRYAAL